MKVFHFLTGDIVLNTGLLNVFTTGNLLFYNFTYGLCREEFLGALKIKPKNGRKCRSCFMKKWFFMGGRLHFSRKISLNPFSTALPTRGENTWN